MQPELQVNEAGVMMVFRSNSQISHKTPTHVMCEDADADLTTN